MNLFRPHYYHLQAKMGAPYQPTLKALCGKTFPKGLIVQHPAWLPHDDPHAKLCFNCHRSWLKQERLLK